MTLPAVTGVVLALPAPAPVAAQYVQPYIYEFAVSYSKV